MPRRSTIALALFAALLTVTSSCSKKRPATDSLPADEISRDDMLREQKQIAAGEVVGERLVSPKIELDYRGVTVNGRLVAAASDLDTTKLARIEKLYACMKGMREHWKMIHPGDAFHGTFELDAAPEADALQGESIIETAAAAGYSRVRLKIEEIAFDAVLGVSLPPRPPNERPAKPDVRLRLRRAIVGWDVDALTSGSCDDVPNVKVRVVKSDALGGLVDELCPSAARCSLSLEATAGALLTIAKLVAPAFETGRPTNVSLDLLPSEGVADPSDAGVESPPPHPHPSASAAKSAKPAKVRTLPVQVNGRLAPEAVEKSLRANLDAARACYETALRRNAALQGRVGIKLTIDASGAVAQACDGGSDLPSSDAIACVVRETSKTTFPAPESGAVNVVYAITFAPP